MTNNTQTQLMLFHHQTRGDLFGTIVSQNKHYITVKLYDYVAYIQEGIIIGDEAVLFLNKSLVSSFAPLAN